VICQLCLMLLQRVRRLMNDEGGGALRAYCLRLRRKIATKAPRYTKGYYKKNWTAKPPITRYSLLPPAFSPFISHHSSFYHSRLLYGRPRSTPEMKLYPVTHTETSPVIMPMPLNAKPLNLLGAIDTPIRRPRAVWLRAAIMFT